MTVEWSTRKLVSVALLVTRHQQKEELVWKHLCHPSFVSHSYLQGI